MSTILPLQSVATGFREGESEWKGDGRRSSYLQLPFTSPYKMPSFLSKRRTARSLVESTSSEDVEDIVKDALDSLALVNLSTEQPDQKSSRMRQSLSYRERSVRLVRHCSSWTLLDDTEENKTHYDGQGEIMILTTVTFGSFETKSILIPLFFTLFCI